MFRLTVPPPPSEGEPATRRPLIMTNVRPAPTPRRSMVALDCALLPDDSRKEPSEFRLSFAGHLLLRYRPEFSCLPQR